MLHYDLTAIKGEDAIGSVMSAANLLALAHCGLHMSVFHESMLLKEKVDPESVRIGAMEATGACSEVLSYLIGEDLLEGACE